MAGLKLFEPNLQPDRLDLHTVTSGSFRADNQLLQTKSDLLLEFSTKYLHFAGYCGMLWLTGSVIGLAALRAAVTGFMITSFSVSFPQTARRLLGRGQGFLCAFEKLLCLGSMAGSAPQGLLP
jgi:hypothetical protein